MNRDIKYLLFFIVTLQLLQICLIASNGSRLSNLNKEKVQTTINEFALLRDANITPYDNPVISFVDDRDYEEDFLEIWVGNHTQVGYYDHIDNLIIDMEFIDTTFVGLQLHHNLIEYHEKEETEVQH